MKKIQKHGLIVMMLNSIQADMISYAAQNISFQTYFLYGICWLGACFNKIDVVE